MSSLDSLSVSSSAEIRGSSAVDRLRRLSPFWIGLLLIVLLSATLRLLSYDFSLPYVDHDDEPNMYLAGLELRGQFDNHHYYDGYPPGYLLVQAAVQTVLDSLGVRGLASTVAVMRLVSILCNLFTIVLIALTARLAAGNWAGILAGTAWGFAPLILAQGVYALPDPPTYMLVAFSLYLASASLFTSHKRWCVWSVVVGVIATLFKYPAISALSLGVLAALLLLKKDRRTALRYLSIQIVLVLGTVVYTFFQVGQLAREGVEARTDGIANLLNLSRIVNNIYYVFLPLNVWAFTLILVVGVGAFWIARRRRLDIIHWEIPALCALVMVGVPWIAASFSQVSLDRIRDVLPATSAACILLGTGLAQLARVVPKRWAYAGASWVVLPWIALILVPQINQDWTLVQNRRLPDRRVELREWFDVNLEPGTVIVDRETYTTFNPFNGGIPYKHWVDWWLSDNLMEHPLAEWRDPRGMSYAVVPAWEADQMNATPEGRAYLAQMLHLRDFNARGWRGPEMAFYRLWRMQIETQYHFGDSIILSGYDRSSETAKSGDTLTLRFYWNVSSIPADNYSLFIHLVPLDDDKPLAQADGAPAVSERPTLTWNDPSETLISPPFQLSIPADLAPGDYRVMIGLYNYTDGKRLPISDADGKNLGDSLELTRLKVDS